MSKTVQEVKQLLDDTLELGDRVLEFDESTLLLGALPELDSMAVVTLVTAIEDQYGVMVEDDEINAETFETLGNLVAFVDQKLNA
jgi:acyl carrier protein